MRPLDLKGKKFFKLLVLEKAKSTRKNQNYWLCLCDCGTEKVFSTDHLTRKKVL